MTYATQFSCATLAAILLLGFATIEGGAHAAASPSGVESRSILDGPAFASCASQGADYVGGVDATGSPVEAADAAASDNGVHVDNDFVVTVPASRHARRGSVDVHVRLTSPGQDTRPGDGCVPSAPAH